MCDGNRRQFLLGGTGFLSFAAEAELLAGANPAGKADQVAPGVYFAEGTLSDTADAVCNNGWIVLEDYVLVIDANFPAGAKRMIATIRSLTDKPIRFALDTHHHGDHAYGNQVFVDEGAVPFAHTGVLEEMKLREPGAWEAAAKGRADVRNSKRKPPSLLFSKDLVFDDGKRRVEVMHLGVAHTHGDSVAWLPQEKILFAGDVCVNGPYNFVGDGDVGKWVATLEAAKKLGAKIVCTGHGPRASGGVLNDQQAFFRMLQDQVGARMAGQPPEEARGRIESVRAALKSDPRVARFAGERGAGWDPFPSQVEKVYQELTGKKLAALARERRVARGFHARSHGLVPA